MRVEDVDEDDENRFEQRRQSLIYTNSSVFGFLSFAVSAVDHSDEIIRCLRMLVVMSITLKVLSRESLALRPKKFG